MTEAEWLQSAAPRPMLGYLLAEPRAAVATLRKLRLFAVACCRRVLHRLPGGAYDEAVDAAEHFADEPPDRNDRLRWVRKLPVVLTGIPAEAAASGIECSLGTDIGLAGQHWRNSYRREFVANAHWWCAESEYQEAVYQEPPDPERWAQVKAVEESEQTHLLRCIVGNPFRPVAVEPSWLTSTVVALARGIYADRAFDRLPILADALMDAGCDNDDVLNHCRDTAPHARGCWVVDLLLGKA
jgi:hypothetical protein